MIYSRLEKVAVIGCLLLISGRGILGKENNSQHNRPIEVVVYTGSPLNIFPQVGLGIQTSTDLFFFAGCRAGASGPLITGGWFYAQFTCFGNFVFLKARKTKIYFGNNLTWRNHLLHGPTLKSNFPQSDKRFFEEAVASYLKEINYSLHLGLKHYDLFFEIGVEFPVFYRIWSDDIELDSEQNNDENRKVITEGIAKNERLLDKIRIYSRFYYVVSKRFY